MTTRRALLQSALASAAAPALLSQTKKRNIVFILTDDHRWDMIGGLNHPWMKGHTPNMDRLLAGGVNFENAFVTSSLCSPSRASILTGKYMHAHRVFDNFSPLDPAHVTFPRLLQFGGYKTAFIGKWHMGGDQDSPQPGFDKWFSFRGQGEYYDPQVNDNGTRRKASGYMTDILTAEANRFISDNAARPFCLYLSHKAVHYPFRPPKKYENLFEGKAVPKPESMTYRSEYYEQLPKWVHDRRYTRHGVDGLLGHTTSFDDAYRTYCQSLVGVDDSVGEVLQQLDERRLLNDTLVVYMGDNGYMWGEHGLIDKRAMYEESIRVPLVFHCPDLFGSSPRKATEMALNLDIAPTFLEAAGLAPSPSMHGRSLLAAAQGKAQNWRQEFAYEYEWEQDYPYTPTITGIRTATHSLMMTQGLWDISELYDLRTDPKQMKNLVSHLRIRGYERGKLSALVKEPELKKTIDELQAKLKQILASTGGDPRRAGQGSEGDTFAL